MSPRVLSFAILGIVAAASLGGLAFLGTIAAVCVSLLGKDWGPESTDTYSRSLTGDAEKVAFLARYLTLATPIEAAEFHVFYRGGGWVPGPSDWAVSAVVKVAPANVQRWIGGYDPATGFDLAWAYALLPDESRWRVTSPPSYYRDAGCEMEVFRPEGVIFKRCCSGDICWGVNNWAGHPPNNLGVIDAGRPDGSPLTKPCGCTPGDPLCSCL